MLSFVTELILMGIVTTGSAWPTNLILIVNQTCGLFFERMEMECKEPVIIKKKLNNNAVIIKSKHDVILMGKGIGYLVKPGDKVDESKIEKRFQLTSSEAQNSLIQVVSTIPTKVITFTDKVVVYLTRTLNKKFDKNIYVALTDHIYYTIKRDNEGLIMNTSLLWEVKDIYPEEYAAALTILHMINQEFSINLPDEEARILSFHILDNEENDQRSTNVAVSVQIITDILNIVKYFFNFTYDQKSLAYTRFIVHLKFLTKRILHHEQETNQAVFFYQQLNKEMPQAFNCMQKIKKYLSKTQDFELSHSEQAYLTIHIQKLILDQTQRSKP